MSDYLDVWRHYASFSGRARRKEYWLFTLFHAVILAAGEMLAAVLYTDGSVFSIAFAWAVGLYLVASIVPTVAVTVRRLHDVDKSGWWYFIGLIPFIGAVWLLILMCTEGTRGPNQFGPDPKETTQADGVDLIPV